MHGVHACRTGQRLCEKGEEDAHVVYFSVDASGNKSKSYPVDVQAAQIMHDFAVTENYAVFLDHALVLDVKHMVKEKSLPFKYALHNTSAQQYEVLCHSKTVPKPTSRTMASSISNRHVKMVQFVFGLRGDVRADAVVTFECGCRQVSGCETASGRVTQHVVV